MSKTSHFQGLAKLGYIVAQHLFYFVGHVAHTSEDIAKLVDFVVEASTVLMILLGKMVFWRANHEHKRLT